MIQLQSLDISSECIGGTPQNQLAGVGVPEIPEGPNVYVAPSVTRAESEDPKV